MSAVKIETVSSTSKKATITVDGSLVAKALEKARQKVGQKAKIKGFREGKVPANVLDQYYGAEIDYEWINNVVGESYAQAITQENLAVMGEPEFDIKPLERQSAQADYTYSVSVEVKPEFDLQNYEGLKVAKRQSDVTDAELNAELERLQKAFGQLESVGDVSAELGHTVTVDFEGTIDGKVFQGGSGKDVNFELGVGQLLKDFENNLVGMKPTQSKTFDVAFPAEYFEKSLAGQTAQFTVTVKAVLTKKLPTLDDDFAKDMGKDSIEVIKNDVRESIKKKKEAEDKNAYLEFVRDTLVASYNFDLPEKLVVKQAEANKVEADLVRKQMKLELILDAIAVKEKIQVTAQEIEQAIAGMAQWYRRPLKEVRDHYIKNKLVPQLASQVLLDKTLDFVLGKANIE